MQSEAVRNGKYSNYNMSLIISAFEFVQNSLLEIRGLFITEFFDFKSIFFFIGVFTLFYFLTATPRTASARFVVFICTYHIPPILSIYYSMLMYDVTVIAMSIVSEKVIIARVASTTDLYVQWSWFIRKVWTS